MKIFKFGGASVKDAEAVKNLSGIVRKSDTPLIIVVSAMGKTTNAMENLLDHYFRQDGRTTEPLKAIYKYHREIIKGLFQTDDKAIEEFELMFNTLRDKINSDPSMTYNFEYDQMVSYGELFSTLIISAYLNSQGIKCQWVDIRKALKTDNNYREARVSFELSAPLIKKAFSGASVFVTQGFIGSTPNNLTTTLGREGSDYTAALLAYFLDASSVTVWKDVPGVLNADPKWFDNTIKLERLSYMDAIELAFYGASVIHPKTIQPLKKKNIPLLVRSFVDPEAEGTVISETTYNQLIPCYIFKIDQVLIDIYPTDLTFIAEENMQYIFSILAKHNLRINLMQNTAVSFRICVNNDTVRIPAVINELKDKFHVRPQNGLELITIRYYDQATLENVTREKEIILEQHTQDNIQMVVKNIVT